LITEFL